MANVKSAIKRIKKDRKAAERNLSQRTKAKSIVKKAKEAIKTGDDAVVKSALKDAAKVLDSVASKGVIHKNKAARLKSRLAKKAAKPVVAEVKKAVKAKAEPKTSAKKAPAKKATTTTKATTTKAKTEKA